MVGTKIYCAPEVTMMQRYNESVDTFSFALILLSLAVGDIAYVVKQYKTTGVNGYVLGRRPLIPPKLQEEACDLCELIKECWNADFCERPKFKDIVPRLEKCASLGNFE